MDITKLIQLGSSSLNSTCVWIVSPQHRSELT